MVRTKQTGKAKTHGKLKANGTPKVNGTPKAPAKTPQSIKSPTQTAELSDSDRAVLKSWLDKQEKPFGVTTVPVSRKRKRASGLQLQADLFEDRLNVKYEVKPRDKWEDLRRYKKFTGT